MDDTGLISLNYVGHFEQLEKGFLEVTNNLQIDNKLKKINQSKHDDYRDVYSDEMIKIVAQIYQDDIDLLNYTFEGNNHQEIITYEPITTSK